MNGLTRFAQRYYEYIPLLGTAASAFRLYHGSLQEIEVTPHWVYRLNRASFLDLSLMAIPILGNLALYIKNSLDWIHACKNVEEAFHYCRKNPFAFLSLPEKMKTNLELCKKIVWDPKIPHLIRDEILTSNDTEDFWVYYIKNQFVLKRIPRPNSMGGNYSDPSLLTNAPEALKDKPSFMVEAIFLCGPSAFLHASNRLQNDLEFVSKVFSYKDEDEKEKYWIKFVLDEIKKKCPANRTILSVTEPSFYRITSNTPS